jgi:hypothetical protein
MIYVLLKQLISKLGTICVEETTVNSTSGKHGMAWPMKRRHHTKPRISPPSKMHEYLYSLCIFRPPPQLMILRQFVVGSAQRCRGCISA